MVKWLYKIITGLSGTLGDMSDEKILKSAYKIGSDLNTHLHFNYF